MSILQNIKADLSTAAALLDEAVCFGHHVKHCLTREGRMRYEFKKFGNSTVAVMPPAVLRDLGIGAGSPFDLLSDGGKIIIAPVATAPGRRYKLADLLAMSKGEGPLPEDDLRSWDAAPPVGNEVI